MTTLVYVIAYLGIVFFLIAVAARFVFWSKMPMHLRWELYPVAHEGGGRAAYGGSYLEESDWWKKKREVSLLGELKVMVPEILFLVALREHNRKLWTWSFPFHFGLYLVAATTIMLLVGGIAGALLPANAAAPINTVIGLCGPLARWSRFGPRHRRRAWAFRPPTRPCPEGLHGARRSFQPRVLHRRLWGRAGDLCWLRPRLFAGLRLCCQPRDLQSGAGGHGWHGGAAAAVVGRPAVTVDGLHPNHSHVALRRQVLRLSLDSLERRPQPAQAARRRR